MSSLGRSLQAWYASVAIGVYERRVRRGSSRASAESLTALLLAMLATQNLAGALIILGWRPSATPAVIWITAGLFLTTLQRLHLKALRGWISVSQPLSEYKLRARRSNVYILVSLALIVAATWTFSVAPNSR